MTTDAVAKPRAFARDAAVSALVTAAFAAAFYECITANVFPFRDEDPPWLSVPLLLVLGGVAPGIANVFAGGLLRRSLIQSALIALIAGLAGGLIGDVALVGGHWSALHQPGVPEALWSRPPTWMVLIAIFSLTTRGVWRCVSARRRRRSQEVLLCRWRTLVSPTIHPR